MKSCERRFGAIICSELGDGICAFAHNEMLNGGDVRSPDKMVPLLIKAGFRYTTKVYLLHSYDLVTDSRVRDFLHPSYAKCIARNEIAAMAKTALEAITGDEVSDLDTLGRVVFSLGPQ